MTIKVPKKKAGRPRKGGIPPLAEMLTEQPKAKPHTGGHNGGRARRELVDVASRLDAYAYDPIKSLVQQAVELGKIQTPDISQRKLRKDIDDILLAYIAAKPRQIEYKLTTDDDKNPLSDLLGLLANEGRPKPPSQDK